MRTLAMTGIVTASTIFLIIAGSLYAAPHPSQPGRKEQDRNEEVSIMVCDDGREDGGALTIRATPPSARMSAGTRSSAMTAHAPASSAMRAYMQHISPSVLTYAG
jgi:hypothetical protein